MNRGLHIAAIVEEENIIVLSREDATQLSLGMRISGYVSFGVLKRFVLIRVDGGRGVGVLSLSKNIIDELHLPLYVSYDIRVSENEIKLGPCIGILLANVQEKITEKRLQHFLAYYVNQYPFHGAVLVFALDQMKQETLTLQGYCYNPKKNAFEKGIFPYPSAIYRRTGIPEAWKNHLLTVLGDKLFNNYYFNKWEIYLWLVEDKGLKEHLPYTVLFSRGEDILPLLERYGKLYIKPVTRRQEKGFVQLTRIHDIRYFKFSEEGEKQEILVTSGEELMSLMNETLKPGEYVFQESVDLLKVGEQLLDFKVMMYKNQHLAWNCIGIVGRLRVAGGLKNNISKEGNMVAFEECMRKQFQKTPQEVFLLQEKITDFALSICQRLDEVGIHCGELEIDIGLDTAYKPWLIEANSREPGEAAALNFSDPMLFYKVRTMPLYYCKALAGFEE